MYSFGDILQHYICSQYGPEFPFLYPLKASENIGDDAFMGCRKGVPASSGLTYCHVQILPQIWILMGISEAFPILLYLK